jgi:hypothetical protein
MRNTFFQRNWQREIKQTAAQMQNYPLTLVVDVA